MTEPSIAGLDGRPFYLPSSDDPRTFENGWTTTAEVWDGEYAHWRLPKDVRTILDIGAGWGAFTAWARRLYPEAYIIGYEPHAAAAALYRRNARGPNEVLHEVAVTIDPAPKHYVDCYWSGGHTKNRTEGIAVYGHHPDQLPRAHLLKCDAEGVEAEVLEHYRFLQELKALMVEWHTPDLKAQCHALVARRAPGLVLVRDERTRGYGVSIWVQRVSV